MYPSPSTSNSANTDFSDSDRGFAFAIAMNSATNKQHSSTYSVRYEKGSPSFLAMPVLAPAILSYFHQTINIRDYTLHRRYVSTYAFLVSLYSLLFRTVKMAPHVFPCRKNLQVAVLCQDLLQNTSTSKLDPSCFSGLSSRFVRCKYVLFISVF